MPIVELDRAIALKFPDPQKRVLFLTHRVCTAPSTVAGTYVSSSHKTKALAAFSMVVLLRRYRFLQQHRADSKDY